MANRDDIARMKYVIDNPDIIEKDTDPKHSKVYRQPHPYLESKTKAAKTILISKKVNGTYYVVEAVPDSATKTVFVVTAYMDNKKRTVSTTDDNIASPVHTSTGNDVNTLPENQVPVTISDYPDAIVSHSDDVVNANTVASRILYSFFPL